MARSVVLGFDGVLDLHTDAAQFRQMRDVDRQADGFAVDDRVERAAEGDVGANLSAPPASRHAAVQHERRHVDERNAARRGRSASATPVLTIPRSRALTVPAGGIVDDGGAVAAGHQQRRARARWS